MENKVYGVVYKITNLVNGKIYVGQTKQRPSYRWAQHKSNKYNNPISIAIRTEGYNNFSFIVVDSALTPQELNKLEEQYIKEYNSLAPNGYNVQTKTNAFFDKRINKALYKNKPNPGHVINIAPNLYYFPFNQSYSVIINDESGSIICAKTFNDQDLAMDFISNSKTPTTGRKLKLKG